MNASDPSAVEIFTFPKNPAESILSPLRRTTHRRRWSAGKYGEEMCAEPWAVIIIIKLRRGGVMSQRGIKHSFGWYM